MERFNDLAIILKSFPYQERDRIAVFLTQNHGKITGLAKGGVHSRRFGGSLDFLACSKIHYVQKPYAEMARIEEAVVHHEFKNLHRDFEKLTAASFCAEFCLRLLESHTPLSEMFSVLSNTVFHLDAGLPVRLAINAFLCKAFKALGYPPSLLRCVQCTKGAHELGEQPMYWYSQAGGMICSSCSQMRFKIKLEPATLFYFHKLTMTPFKQLEWKESDPHSELYRVLSDFLHHHIPGIPAGGFKSWKLLNESAEPLQPLP